MVGTLIFKDFETGSYEYMRVTMYEGASYKDIERESEFSSCLVSLERKSVSYDLITSDKAPRLSLHSLLTLCRKAKEFLYENDYVTIADFCINDNGIDLRKRSSKSGIYAPVDMRAALDPGAYDVYRLCRVEQEDTHLGLSVRCTLLNYCLGRLFDVEEEIFGISGRGIYISCAAFAHDAASMKMLSLPKNMRKLIKTKRRRHCVPRRTKVSLTQIICAAHTQPHLRLIFSWRRVKLSALSYASRKLSNCMKCRLDFALSLIDDGYISGLARDFCTELREYVSNYDFCFKSKSHADYISVADALYLVADINSAEQISQRAAALSANMKLRDKLPCPDYYDSYGRAYNN